MTLPVCIFEKGLLPIDVEEGEKTHTEKVNAYKAEFFVMTSAYNDEKREQFVLVVDTVLANLAAQSQLPAA
jgi:hypothetical protein